MNNAIVFLCFRGAICEYRSNVLISNIISKLIPGVSAPAITALGPTPHNKSGL